MYKLVAIYRVPEDPETFEAHYFDVHAPLMAKVPGYLRTEVSKTTRHLFGEPEIYLMFEMWFADKESLKNALKSPENAEAGKDLMGFAKHLVSVFTVEVVETNEQGG